ncbi:hypothetical protein E3P81_01237 [Wallemia ichthyophaga]|nr:hypothetical protein E3P97_01238 [Wallemia ichthyophaga]TIB34206.1 hypothetical protein E3P85_00987 [Wallemia ichthyophaga]TIB48505.1 hypothetical protein E3P82_01236 [Wallemia ichthyophaga]TIB52635.1 hypothetical protein E3P81_01237 [Wallemia ichthyophaga]TIB55261.1 hypothetical protein E3P80_01237 [Wallemia ichthyophaga]
MSLFRLEDVAFEVLGNYFAVSLHLNEASDSIVGGSENSNPRNRSEKFKFSLSKKTRRMAFEKRIERMKSDKVKASEDRIATIEADELGLRSPELYMSIINYESSILRSFYSSSAYITEKTKFDLGSPLEDFARKLEKTYRPVASSKQLIIVVGDSMMKGKGHAIVNSLIERSINVVLVSNDSHTVKKCSICHYTLKSCYLRAVDDDAKRREFSVAPKEGYDYVEQLKLCDSNQCKAYAAAQVDQNNRDRASSSTALSPFHDLRIVNVDVNCYVNRLVLWSNKYRPLFMCSNRRQRHKIKSLKKADRDAGREFERKLECFFD